MNSCCITPGQNDFEQPTPDRLAGLGAGCFVQIHRNEKCEWIEITRVEGEEYVGTLHPALSTPRRKPVAPNKEPNNTPSVASEEIRLRKDHITALGCDRYCTC